MVVLQTGSNDFNVEICSLQSTGNSAYVKSAITSRLVIAFSTCNGYYQSTSNSHSVLLIRLTVAEAKKSYISFVLQEC